MGQVQDRGADELHWAACSVLLRAAEAGWIDPFAQDGRTARLARSLDWGRLERLPGGGLMAPAGERGSLRRHCPGDGLLVGRVEPAGSAYLWSRGGRQGPELLRAAMVAGREWRAAARERRARTSVEHAGAVAARAAGLVHDLRNQLTLASGYTQRLRSTGSGLHDLERALQGARELATRALEQDSGAHPVALDLRAQLLREARGARAAARGAGQPPLRVRCPAGWTVLADATALSRLLRNTMCNALEASPPGAEVRVEGRLGRAGEYRVLIRDRGRGMSRERLAECLRPGVSGAGGSGWGMRAVLDALAELDAELRLSSWPGRGTRVEIRLPAAPPGEPARRLVLLDPEAERRSHRARALGGLGWQVLACARAGRARVLAAAGAAWVVVARGVAGNGMAALESACALGRVRLLVARAGQECWRDAPGRFSPASATREWPAGRRD